MKQKYTNQLHNTKDILCIKNLISTKSQGVKMCVKMWIQNKVDLRIL